MSQVRVGEVGRVKKKPTNTEAGWNKVSKVRDAWLVQKTPGTPCWQSGHAWLKEGAMRLGSHEGVRWHRVCSAMQKGMAGFLSRWQWAANQGLRTGECQGETCFSDSSTKVHTWGYGIWRGTGRQRVELGCIILVRWKFFDKTWGTLAGIERQK